MKKDIKIGNEILWTKDSQVTSAYWKIVRKLGIVVGFTADGRVKVNFNGEDVPAVVKLADLVLIDDNNQFPITHRILENIVGEVAKVGGNPNLIVIKLK